MTRLDGDIDILAARFVILTSKVPRSHMRNREPNIYRHDTINNTKITLETGQRQSSTSWTNKHGKLNVTVQHRGHLTMVNLT